MIFSYENIRKILARYTFARRVHHPDCILRADELNVRAASLQPELRTRQPEMAVEPEISTVPELNAIVKRVDNVTCNRPISIRPLRPERVCFEPVLLTSRAEFSVKAVRLGTQARCVPVPLVWQMSLRRKNVERYRIKLVNMPPRCMPGMEKVHRYNPAFRRAFRVDLGLACRMPMHRKRENLGNIGKKDLLKYWRLLLRKAPSGMGKDIELLAVYRNVDVEQYCSFEFDGLSSRLRLRPKLPSQRSAGEGRRCDIIFGRYKPLGTILTAVIGSD